MLCFWMKAFTSRDMDLTAFSGELYSQAAFHVRPEANRQSWSWADLVPDRMLLACAKLPVHEND